MDTKLKNSKYHPLIKLVAVLLTIIFAFTTGISALYFLRTGVYLADNDLGLRNTPTFAIEINKSMIKIKSLKDVMEFYEEDMTYAEYLETDKVQKIIKSYNQKEKRAIKIFNTIQELKKIRPKTIETKNGTYDVDENGVVYFPETDEYISSNEFYDTYNNYYYDGEYSEQATSVAYEYDEVLVPVPENDDELLDIKDEYTSYSDWNYKYQQLRSAIFDIVEDAISVEQIKAELNNKKDEEIADGYYADVEHITEEINTLVNVKFILKDNKTGKILSNVKKENRKVFINTLDDDDIFHINFNGKKLLSEPHTINNHTNLLKFLTDIGFLVEEAIDENYLIEHFRGYTLYLKIDDMLHLMTSGDNYYNMKRVYNNLPPKEEANDPTFLTMAIVSALLSIGCFVFCCIFSGRRKDGSVKPAVNDKVPFVLYLACTVALVGAIGFGVGAICLLDFNTDFLFNPYDSLQWFFTPELNERAVGLGFSLISLFLLSFALYIARNVKAETLGNRFITIFLFRKLQIGVKKLSKTVYSIKQIRYRVIAGISLYLAINILLLVILISEFITPIVPIVLLAVFNSLGITYALLYISDVIRLSKLAEEIRNGNYNQKIEAKTFVTPLRMFALDLDACRDGIENAINEAIKGEHLKTELITNVSHDLKTPLTSIINYVSLLKIGNIEGEEERKYIDILDEKSKKLKRLIEDLTEASKANSGNIKMNVAQVNLNEMALQAVGENSDVLENAGLDVILTERDKEIIVNADSQHTFRIIDNLFSNAKKYSLTGTRVYVDVYKENSFGVFEIKNISREKLNIDPHELTERFVRGDNSRTTDGSGLGLSIAQSFADLQNGSFNIEIDGDMFKAVVKLPLI